MTSQRALAEIPHFFAPRSPFAQACRCGRQRDDPIHLRPGDVDVQNAIEATSERGSEIKQRDESDA